MSKSSIKLDPAAQTQVKIVDDAFHVTFSMQEKMGTHKFLNCAHTILTEAGYEVDTRVSHQPAMKRKYVAKYGKDFVRFLSKADEIVSRPSGSAAVAALMQLEGFMEVDALVTKVVTLAASFVKSPEDLNDLQYFLSGNDLCLSGRVQMEALVGVVYQHFYPKRDQVMAWLTPLIEKEAVDKAAQQKAAHASKQKQMAQALRAAGFKVYAPKR